MKDIKLNRLLIVLFLSLFVLGNAQWVGRTVSGFLNPAVEDLDMNGNSIILDVDGDTLIRNPADDEIMFKAGNVDLWVISGNETKTYGVNSWLLNRVTATATTGTLCPNKADTDTSIGSAGANLLSFITGGVETMRLGKSVDTDSDTDDVLSTGFSGYHALAIVISLTDNVSAIFHVDNVTVTGDISLNALITSTKDNAATYNFYYDTDQFKLQNKVGDNKSIQVLFWVLPTS